MSGSGRETITDVLEWWEALPDIWEWSKGPPESPGAVEKPSRIPGREAILDLRKW